MKPRPLVVVASALLAAAAVAPYAWHHARPPAGTRFTGAVFYRDDFYQYLSFAEQAAGGALVFRNKFDVAAHPAALVNLEWWTAGVLGRRLGGPAAGLEALRLISVVALVAAVSRALALGGLQGRHHAAALALVLAAGGSGWLLLWAGVPGWQVADVAIGFYPFHQALTNGHFVAGAALLLWSVVLLVEWRAGRRGSAAWVAAAWALGLTRPYDLATFALCGGVALRARPGPGAGPRRRGAAGAAPDLAPAAVRLLRAAHRRATRRSAGWGGHGLDLSPPRYAYLLALLPVGAFLGASVALARRGSSPFPARSARRSCAGGWRWRCWWRRLIRRLARQCVVSAGLVTLLLAALAMPPRWLPWATLAAAPTSVFLLWRMFNPWPESFAPVEYFEAQRTGCAPPARRTTSPSRPPTSA